MAEKRTTHLSWTFDFPHSVEEIWGPATDTDRMDRAIGLTAIEYRHEPDPRGGSFRYGKTRFGGMTLEWLEHPYEWERYKYYKVLRVFKRGPVRAMEVRWIFEKTGEGCRLRQEFQIHGFRLLSAIVRTQILLTVRNRTLAAYRHLSQHLSKRAPTRWPPLAEDQGWLDAAGFERIMARLRSGGVEEALSRRMVEFVAQSQLPDLVKIRPIELAKIWKSPSAQVVEGFLRATRAGVFTMTWGLLCPSCQGSKGEAPGLAELKAGAHCDSCNIEYGVEFDRSVELTFRLSPAIRKIQVGTYCVGGPQNTPHFLHQIRLQPGEVRRISVELDEGMYRIRSPQGGTTLEIEAGSVGETEALRVSLGGSRVSVQKKLRAGDRELEVSNPTDREVLCIVEHAKWLENACTAAYVSSLQTFRDLFASEVLRPGQEISVGGMAILFTDLKGSTAMYNRIGDAVAFSLVRDHFEILIEAVRSNEGCLVKTIGDAVMAAFHNPENALRAAFAIHRGIAARNQAKAGQEPLHLKVGVHYGSCFAVNLNERLDYFGSTVNIAARTEGQCKGDDVVFTESMLSRPEVATALKDSGLSWERFEGDLKGFSEKHALIRVDCAAARNSVADFRSQV